MSKHTHAPHFPPDAICLDRSAARKELQTELFALSFHAFEQCICELLLAQGYTDVRLLGRTFWRQPTRHGGADLLASSHTGVSHSRIVLQVKQYRRPVSRRFVDELRGTILRCGGGQGLIITTSTFSAVARQAAKSNQLAPIRLVDGEELLDLLFAQQVGVWPNQEAENQQWHVDRAYFATLRQVFPGGARLHSNTPKHHAGLTAHLQTNRRALASPGAPGGNMQWRTHAVGGLSSLWLLSLVPGALAPSNLAILAAAAALGALLPDLDAAEAKVKHLGVWGLEPFVPLAELTHRTFGHRGLMHSLFGVLVIAVMFAPVAWTFAWPPYLALLVGYLSHLALDACTVSGIPFAPWRRSRQHLLPRPLRIVTGSHMEELFFISLALCAFVLVLTQLQHAAPR